MSMFRLFASIAVLFLSLLVSGATPDLGVPITAEDLNEIDFVVLPNGDGLPPGSGDARGGFELYKAHCLACHGVEGQEGINDRLAGGHGSLAGSAPVKTVGSYWPYATTVFDYLRRAMPYTAPGSLSADDVYALTAYLLFINGVIDEDAPMDATALPHVKMPNADNFVWAVPDQ
jgi:hypothetical protein